MKTRLFVLLFIFSSSFSVFSQNTEVVKDIISGVDGSLPENLITFRDRLYFSAITEENGRELWVSDGTAIGTFLFKDISTPSLLGQDTNSNPSNFVVYNNKLYFSAFDETNGNELWETDGTVHGTKLAVDIFPGSGSSFPRNLFVYNNKMYFSAHNGSFDVELWESDGTSGGTRLFKNLNTSTVSNRESSNPSNFVIFNGKMYFSAYTYTEGTELWESNGTAAGTKLLKDINTENSFASSSPKFLTVYNNKLYFQATNGTSNDGNELWVSDGTTSGTNMFIDLNTTSDNLGGSNPSYLTVFNGKLYFSAFTKDEGVELRVTDGTVAGTTIVKDLVTVSADPFIAPSANPTGLKVFNNKLYFEAFTSNQLGSELWVTDGTEAGTVVADDINQQPSNSIVTSSSFVEFLTVFNNKLFFSANNGLQGKELCSFNPTEVSTADNGLVTKTTALLGGEVVNQGVFPIFERGIIYSSKNSQPELNGADVLKNSNGAGLGMFTETITNLDKKTTYYYRSYALYDTDKVSYGSIKQFTTYGDEPTVVTNDVTNISSNSLDLNGEVINIGDSPVTERGFVYSITNTNPQIGEQNVFQKISGNGSGAFLETITGLLINTKTYYVKSYAINNEGISYGNVKVLTRNNALHFKNGTSNKVTIPYNSKFDFSNNFTIEAWVLVNGLNKSHPILNKRNTATNQLSFNLFLNSVGNFRFEFSSDGVNKLIFDAENPSVKVGEWNHVAITYNGTNFNFFVNGNAAGTKNFGSTIFSENSPLTIGNFSNLGSLDGAIDEVRIWSEALTQNQISTRKDGMLPEGNVKDLVAYYNFNDGIANGNNIAINRTIDRSPNNLHANLESFEKTGSESNFIPGVDGIFTSARVLNVFENSGLYTDANNWSLGVVPTSTDKIIIQNGLTVSINIDDLVVDDFELEDNATLIIPENKEIIIQNNFKTQGNLELQSNEEDSGVLFTKGNVSGTITYKRGGLKANQWHIVTPPVSGQKINDFVNFAQNNIRVNNDFKFAVGTYNDNLSTGNKWQYYDGLNPDFNAEFVAGQSYAISKATDGFVTFTGTLATEDINKSADSGMWNAIGNPFTTYYPANKNSNSSFLSENLNSLDDTFKSLYIWDSSQNKYVAITELDNTSRSLPPGQGFFIKLKNSASNVSFNALKRTLKPQSGTTTFSKSQNTEPQIEISLSNSKTNVKTNIKYFENATKGFDVGLDIGNFNGASVDIFSYLVNENENQEFTIQSLPKDDFNAIIPLGLVTKVDNEYAIKMDVEDFPTNANVILEDRMLSKFIDFNLEDEYRFISTNKNINNRFYIHIESNVLNTNSFNLNETDVFINQNKEIVINGIKDEKVQIIIFSILGKKVFEDTVFNQNHYKANLSKLNSGVYLVKVQGKNLTKSKKIVIR